MEPQNLPKILYFAAHTVEHKLSANRIELRMSSEVDTVVGDTFLLQSLITVWIRRVTARRGARAWDLQSAARL